jgi:hypothetical protein
MAGPTRSAETARALIPLPFMREFEAVIMIEVVTEEIHGSN